MIKASIDLQDLRRRLYVKAKAETTWRFWGLYVHICKTETLRQAYALAKENDGAPGVDGVTFEAIEVQGVEAFLEQIRDELVQRTYKPLPARKQEIPKDGGKVRVLSIPAIRDRVVQGALKLILEPIFEADFQPGSFGYRPKKTAHEAVDRVAQAIVHHKTRVIDFDLRSYFDNVRHDRLLAKVATRYGAYTGIEYARFADDLVIWIDAHPRHDWLLPAVEKRLREELAALQVEVNEEKSRIVDLSRGESFGFLGFDFRRIRSGRGAWRAQFTPKLKKRTALLRKLKEIFRRHRSQPVNRVIQLINPILRGWVNYFTVGHSSECFRFVQNWVEKKVRRHMMKARKRKGFGWTRWSRQWLYDTLKLFNGYKVKWLQPKVAPAG